MWLWDDTGVEPWNLPFYENFSALKLSTRKDNVLASPTGATIEVVEPGMVYGLRYADRKRVEVDLTFRGLERPVPLRHGTPPYPAASHYDQIGHVTGQVLLDGERIAVDCYAMRDRSWGVRTERGYGRVGYTWLGDRDCSLLTYAAPTTTTDDIHSGYLRQDEKVTGVVSGEWNVVREPVHSWVGPSP